LRAVAFELDAASLASLREALPECAIELVNGATADSLTRDWQPGTADLLVVKAREEVTETLGLCRFLVSCGVLATDSPKDMAETLGLHQSRQNQAGNAHAPLLVLVRPGRESVVRGVLKTGAHSCLLLPIFAKDVASMLVHSHDGNQPGRHTLNLEQAQTEDRWRDDGGEG
jgi:hypothetical protein